MREIKFRGMGLNGDWYYGHLSYLPEPYEGRKVGYYIANAMGMPWAYPVRPETIGQLIGLPGKTVYEGDVITCSMSFEGGVLPHRGEIVYDETFGAFGTKNDAGITLLHNHCLHTVKVIGNKIENPEMLGS